MTSFTILVVEDDDDLRDLAVGVLSEFGHRVIEAANAEEALRILDREPQVDLLFTDIVMPGNRDGFALAREALSRRPHLKLLYTTGFARSAGPEDVMAPVLKKPYRPSQMTAMISRMLEEV